MAVVKSAISSKQRNWLLGQMNLWSEKGILSKEQAGAILDLYETTEEISSRKRHRVIFVLMGLAVFLVGLAALLLIGYNWEAIPRSAKLAIIFLVVAGTYGEAFYLRYSRGLRTTSEPVFFLGCFFYGGGIWLIAQIFHMNAHYPDGVYWWALGVLPFALCLDTLLLHALFVGLMGLWAGLEVLEFRHLAPWFSSWPASLPNGAYSLPFLSIPGLLWGYRKGSRHTVALYVALLAWWAVLQPIAWNWGGNVIYFIGSVGSLFLIIGESHRPGSPFAVPYRTYGALICCGVLVPLSFHDANIELARYGVKGWGFIESAAIVGLALVTLAVIGAVKRSSTDKDEFSWGQMRGVFRRQWFPTCLLVFMALFPLWRIPALILKDAIGAALVPTFAANCAMIVCAFWLMSAGLREDRIKPFAGGVIYFLLWAVLRYVDLFGDFGGMLGASLMFFLCGATLLGVALYWRRRKEMRHA